LRAGPCQAHEIWYWVRARPSRPVGQVWLGIVWANWACLPLLKKINFVFNFTKKTRREIVSANGPASPFKKNSILLSILEKLEEKRKKIFTTASYLFPWLNLYGFDLKY
jgi:hypothetical protein